MRRVPTGLLLAGLGLLVSASPAVAHTELIASSPAEGATLSAAPSQVQLTFNGAVRAALSTITVTGPDGSQWTVGQPTVANTVLTVPVRPAGPAGQYTIGYRIVSGDGHPVSGTVRFTLSGPVDAAAAQPGGSLQPAPGGRPAAPQATAPDGGGVPAWAWAVGALVLLGIGLVIALRIGRPSGSDEHAG